MVDDRTIFSFIGQKDVVQDNPIMGIKVWKIFKGNSMFGFGKSPKYLEPNVNEVPFTIRLQDPNVDNLLSAPSLILRLSSLQIELNQFPINLWMRMRELGNVGEGVKDERLSGQWHVEL